ncbi:MAG: hypothetical protein LUD50_07165 [Clostridia bacterium]|nr:hypothetical protein [Clostridia bacterium]
MVPADTDNLMPEDLEPDMVPYEDRACLTAGMDDLHLQLIREYLQSADPGLYSQLKGEDLITTASALHLICGFGDSLRPSNAAVLMFSWPPEKYLPHARIDVALLPRHAGISVQQSSYTGPLPTQFMFALESTKSFALVEMVIKHPDIPEADRVLQYPGYSIDELLANAVYYHSYQSREPIKVKITPTEITVTCYPAYKACATRQDIMSGNMQGRICPNERIADFLSKLRLLDYNDLGYQSLKDDLKKNGNGPPVFETDPDMRALSVTIPAHPCFLPEDSAKDRPFKDRILFAIKGEAMSSTELAAAMEYKGITSKLSAAVKEMLREGTLYRVPAGVYTKLKATHPVRW